MKKMIRFLTRNPYVQHGVFWLLSFYILLSIFSGSSTVQKIDLIYTAIFLASVAIPVLLNLYLLLPALLKKGRYVPYALAFIVSLGLFAWMNQMLFGHLIDYILPGYFFISFYSYADLLKFFVVFMGITTLLQLSKEWFILNEARQRVLMLEKEKTDAELKALANQVNPHFLFNSLNVIYSLAVNRKDESPEAILKLSDILRYVIYGSAGERVPLESEIRLIRNYIDLQRFRVGHESIITFDTEVANPKAAVAPMLFLPLVENGFKHGVKGDVKNTFLRIRLTESSGTIIFRVENNKGTVQKDNGKHDAGVGLRNIGNRLRLIYPDRHALKIDEKGDTFRVELVIRTG